MPSTRIPPWRGIRHFVSSTCSIFTMAHLHSTLVHAPYQSEIEDHPRPPAAGTFRVRANRKTMAGDGLQQQLQGMPRLVPHLAPGLGPEPDPARLVGHRGLGPPEEEVRDLELVEQLAQPVDEEERGVGGGELEAARQ